MMYPVVVIFGGAGFIGSNFAAFLLEYGLSELIILADITRENENTWPESVKKAEKNGYIKYVEVDVRYSINSPVLPQKCDLIANFAAVHREPGHKDFEFFETNLSGANNICFWASVVNCKRVIFTSSIASYGFSSTPKTEKSLTAPVTAYGSSKLIAEKIHEKWQAEEPHSRFLIIVRPGVVFGPGENGNVQRMLRALCKGYFFYTGNKATVKAGGYIKELTRSLVFVLGGQEKQREHVTLYNFSFPNPPSFEEYVENIKNVVGISRKVSDIPFGFVMFAGALIDLFARPIGISHPFSPERLNKLTRSNYIVPEYLSKHKYKYKYTLRQALEDWKKDKPQDWY